MASGVVDVFHRIAVACERVGARFCAIGAQAVILHGFERFTKDVDVSVVLGGEAKALVNVLVEEGFELLVTDAAEFVRRARVLPLRDRATRLLVDVVLAGPGLEQVFHDRAVVRTVDGERIPVVRPEDLVAMKILAGRAKDLEDVVGVTAAQRETFDVAMARETIRLLERALDRRDLMPMLDDALRRAGLGPKKRRPKKALRRRS